MKFFHALLKCPMKKVVLIGNDGQWALTFNWKKGTSPSLVPLHDELVDTDEFDEYIYGIHFKNLSSYQIIEKLKEVV